MDVERILKQTPATLTVTFYGGESPVDADGTVAFVLQRISDDSIVDSANATKVGTAGSGTYKRDLLGYPQVDNLYATWTGDFSGVESVITTYLDVVGGFYFPLAELRSSDSSLVDSTKYPTEVLEAARHNVEAEFEKICNRAFVPRFAKELIGGDGTPELVLRNPEPMNILSLEVEGEDWMSKVPDIVSDGHRIIELDDGSVWPASDVTNVVIEYEYGQRFCPSDIKEAALRRAKNRLVAKTARIDERAVSMQITDMGTFQLATPGRDGSFTGIPDVDVVLERWALIQSGGVR